MPYVINATKAREKFAELIDRVLYRGEEFVIQKQGKPAALVTQIKPLKKKGEKQKLKPTDFLLKLPTYNLKGRPKNLAKDHVMKT